MKASLRKELIERRTRLEDKANKDGRIFEGLILSDIYKKSRIIMTYVGMSSEVDTKKIILHALKEGKRVCVPKVMSKTKMDICEIGSIDELVESRMGIMEPADQRIVPVKELDLIIVPALAYDRNGFRLGYGGGYYDRMLNGLDCVTVGLCYDEFILDSLPVECHDIPVRYIFTDKEGYAVEH